MDEMYSAMPGSPITYLTSDISAGQTTIAVADDTALPDAPNICTIGYGEHIETIRYGAKSNGVLQDVTRGIEGTPRAWQSGTEVARFYTAYDHNAIIQTIMTHEAEGAKKHITESGSNASGSYIKFDDGTLICYRKMSLIYQSQRFLAPPSNARWAYPAGYIEAPNVQISKSSTWTSERYTFANIGISGDVASAEVRLYSAPDHPFASDDSYSVHLFAIGRWKA